MYFLYPFLDKASLAIQPFFLLFISSLFVALIVSLDKNPLSVWSPYM